MDNKNLHPFDLGLKEALDHVEIDASQLEQNYMHFKDMQKEKRRRRFLLLFLLLLICSMTGYFLYNGQVADQAKDSNPVLIQKLSPEINKTPTINSSEINNRREVNKMDAQKKTKTYDLPVVPVTTVKTGSSPIQMPSASGYPDKNVITKSMSKNGNDLHNNLPKSPSEIFQQTDSVKKIPKEKHEDSVYIIW